MDSGGQSGSREPREEGTTVVRVDDDGAWGGVVTVGVQEVVRLECALQVEGPHYLLMDYEKKQSHGRLPGFAWSGRPQYTGLTFSNPFDQALQA